MSTFSIESWEEPFSCLGVLTSVSLMISPQFQKVLVMCDCEFNTLGNCSSSAFILIWLFILSFHVCSCFYLA